MSRDRFTASARHRMSKAEKLELARAPYKASRSRCVRCKVQVEDRDRAGHLLRCWAALVSAAFDPDGEG